MCRSQTLNTSPFVKREVQAKAVTHLLQYSKSFRKRVGERHWFELEHEGQDTSFAVKAELEGRITNLAPAEG